MPAERVVIDIEVNSDIATIEATREALERLTSAQRRYNRERDREPRGGGGGRGGDDDSGRGGRGGRGGGRGGRGGRGGSSRSRARYAGFVGEVFDFRGDAGKAIASYGKLLGIVNKLAMISLPLMMAALGGISLAFKAGTYFVKMYKAAMSTLSSSVGIAFVALTTFLAAQREFSAVQNSPAYYQGTVNTTDRFVAAGQALAMFTDNTQLAVVGAKGLQASFSTLSKVKPVTGETVAAYTSLMDVVAGSGGDLEKGSQKLADFLAAVQKKGSLAGGAEAAKELGPDFEKIVKEAGALGIKTSEEFLKAAAEGKLGETFATKYAGTLDALNNTVMGRFKQAVTAIKGQLTDLGGEYLGETGGAISRLQGIISKVIARLSYVLQDFDVSKKMGKFLDAVDKGADKLIVLMTKYLGTTPTIFQFFKNSFNTIGNAFDRMQDWMRQFQAAGELINKYFFKPLFSSLGTSFTTSMQSLADTIEQNKGSIQSFAQQLAKTLIAIGKYSDVVRKLFIAALPVLQLLLKGVELFFKGLAAFGKAALTISGVFKKLGPLGKVAGALVNVAALYSLFTLATRFFRVFGTMFGKNMKQTGQMNVQAGVVNVNGSPMGGPGGPSGGGRGGRSGRIGNAVRNYAGGYGPMIASAALMLGGSYLSSKGSDAKGYSSAGGTALKTAGLTAQGTGAGIMILGQGGLSAIGGGSALAGTGALAVGLAGAAGAYGAGSYAAGKFNDDSVKSRSMSALAGVAGGAATGAAAGAILTSWLGPGAAGGAAVGAVVGALIGGVTGYVKAGKQRKETRKAAKALVEEYGSSVEEAIAGGNVDDLLAARDKMVMDRAKLVNTNADPAYAAKAVAKYDEEFEKLNSQIDNYTNNVGISDKYFGVGAESLNKLAMAAGIDLTGKMLNFREVLNLVGKTAEEKARLIKVAWANIGSFAVSEAMSYFDKKEQAKEQGKMLNATQSRILTGDTSEATSDQYLKQMLDYNVSKFGDVGGITNAFVALENQLTTGSLKDISDTQKQYLRNELVNAGATPEALLKNIDSTELATLVGGNTALDAYKKEDGTIDGTKLMELIKGKIAGGDSAFLANFIEAQQSSDPTVAAFQTASLINTGAVPAAMLGATGTMSPVERTARGMNGVPPAASPTTNVVNTTVNASVLDRKTIDQIERVIAKAIRDQAERGSTTVTPKS